MVYRSCIKKLPGYSNTCHRGLLGNLLLWIGVPAVHVNSLNKLVEFGSYRSFLRALKPRFILGGICRKLVKVEMCITSYLRSNRAVKRYSASMPTNVR